MCVPFADTGRKLELWSPIPHTSNLNICLKKYRRFAVFFLACVISDSFMDFIENLVAESLAA